MFFFFFFNKELRHYQDDPKLYLLQHKDPNDPRDFFLFQCLRYQFF